MEVDKDIVINDLLSFLSCKIKSVSREKLLRNIRNYYKPNAIFEAQRILLDNLPAKKSTRHGRRVKNPDTLVAIYDCFQLIPEEDLPVFVCRNLNNVPTILEPNEIKKEVCDDEDLEDDLSITIGEQYSVHNNIKEEQRTMKTQIADISDAVKQIKDHISQLATQPVQNFSDDENSSPTTSNIKLSRKRKRNNDNLSPTKERVVMSIDESIEISPSKVNLSNPTKKNLAYLQQIIDEEMENDRENDSDNFDDGGNEESDDEFSHDKDELASLCEVVVKEEEPQQFHHARTKRNVKDILSKKTKPKACPSSKVIYIKTEGEDVVLQTDEELNFEEIEENSIVEITAADALDNYGENSSNRIGASESVIVVSQFPTDDPESRDILFFTCSQCNLTSKDKSTFNGHVCYSKTMRKPRRPRNGLHCSICEYDTTADNVVDFNEHMLFHYDISTADRYECILCVFYSTDSIEYRNHLFTHSWKRPYRCKICPYKCTKELRFKNHLIRHLEYKGLNHYECIICAKICGTRNTMEKHKQMHKRNFDFKCHHCSITFRHKSALSQHILLSHTKERTFVCSICKCLYDSQHSLDIHMKVHFKDNFFTCHVCFEKFTSKTTFRNHIISKHKDVKPFSCDICHEAFMFNHTMLRHKKTHSSEYYGCPYCNKRFKCPSYLKLHCAIHEGERPFKCSMCNFDSNSKTELKKHMVIHDDLLETNGPNIVLLSCNKCDFVTAESLDLENHKDLHTNDCKEEDFIDQVLVVMDQDESEIL